MGTILVQIIRNFELTGHCSTVPPPPTMKGAEDVVPFVSHPLPLHPLVFPIINMAAASHVA